MDEKYPNDRAQGIDPEYARKSAEMNAHRLRENEDASSKFAGKPFVSGVTLDNVENVFRYQEATPDQLVAFDMVRESLTLAAKTILRVVPPCADRTTAIRKLREARMDANSAIALRGMI